MNKVNSSAITPSLVERFRKWLFGDTAHGFGTFLLGVAAISALLQSPSLLSQILKIQSQADQISSAVTELKNQSKQISTALELLGMQLKELKASQTLASSPVFREPNSTEKQIENAVRQALPTKPTKGHSSVFLPESKIDQTVKRLFKARTQDQKMGILQQSLQVSPNYLTTEDGDSLTTETGNNLIQENKNGNPKGAKPASADPWKPASVDPK